LLHVETIPDSTWLEQTLVKPNDILLSIDETPCYEELNCDDIDLIWQTSIATTKCVHKKRSYISIKTYTPPLTRLQSFRRTAVAVGGSALVGTGAVLMVTPLHPVGHAMAIGGLGVLGTEFDGPKNLVKGITNKIRSRNSKIFNKDNSSISNSNSKNNISSNKTTETKV
jgi:hypothetical protein